MSSKSFTPIDLLIPILAVLLSFCLNYLSSSYSEMDLFKLNLAQKQNPNSKKLIFILKNNHLLFTIVCFFQVILNMLVSSVFIDNLKPYFSIIEKRTGMGKYSFLFLIAFSIALFTELLARFLAVKKSNQKIISKPFFVNLTYLILRPFSFLQIIIEPKKKLFSDSEEDIIRFFNNLLAEKVLEEKEVRLVQSALNFDELTIEHLIVHRSKVIFLEETMSIEEVEKIYAQSQFTRYPVLDKKKKLVGILSIKRLFLSSIEGKKGNWQNQINKKIPYLLSSTKLNKAFEKTQTWNCRMLIVITATNPKPNSTFKGIITLHDILNSLVGKINNNPEKSFPLLPA